MRNDPKTGWSKYNKSRRDEGQLHTERMRKVAYKARHIMGMPKGRRDWRVSAMLVGMVKSEEYLSYWSLFKHFRRHHGDLERCELYGPYSRTQYQLQDPLHGHKHPIRSPLLAEAGQYLVSEPFHYTSVGGGPALYGHAACLDAHTMASGTLFSSNPITPPHGT